MIRFFTLLMLGGLLSLASAAQVATFAPAASYSTGAGSGPIRLVVAELNGDGKLDIITSNYYNYTTSVLLGNGNGTFQPAVAYPLSGRLVAFGIAVADVNNDDKPDLLATIGPSGTVTVRLGNGDGTFQGITSYSTGYLSSPSGVTAADVTNDGHLDLLVANSSTSTIGVFVGTSSGIFQPMVAYSTGSGSGPYEVKAADINGDGRLDLLTANHTNNSASVLLGTSTGTFGAATSYSMGSGYSPVAIAVADANADGKPDLFLNNSTNNTIGVLLSTSSSVFQPVVIYSVASGSGMAGLLATDINNDTKLDLLVANRNSSATVLLGIGNGTFQAPVNYSTGSGSVPNDIAVADVKSDGQPDIIVADQAGSAVKVLLNTTPLAARATLPGSSASLAPNPTSASTTLTLAGLPATVTQVQATLFDATGRTVGQQQLAAAQGTARADVPTTGLAAGLYVLRLTAYDAQGQLAGSLPTQRLSVR